MKHRSSIFIAAVIATALLGGCAIAPAAPTAQLAAGRTAVDQARMAGAMEAAPIEYDGARAKLLRAEGAYQAQDYTLATRLAREAEVDAQLAQARTSAIRSQQALVEINASIRALQSEIDRARRGG